MYVNSTVNVNQFAIFSTLDSHLSASNSSTLLQEEWEGRGAQRKTVCVCVCVPSTS